MFNSLINTIPSVCYFKLYTCLLQKSDRKRDVPNNLQYIYIYVYIYSLYIYIYLALWIMNSHDGPFLGFICFYYEFPFCPSFVPELSGVPRGLIIQESSRCGIWQWKCLAIPVHLPERSWSTLTRDFPGSEMTGWINFISCNKSGVSPMAICKWLPW